MVHTIGSRLRAWRKSLGLKQDEAPSRFGVPPSSYQKYELNLSAPGAEALARFVAAGLNVNWLLAGDGPMLLADLTPRLSAQESVTAYRGAPTINVDALAAIIEGALKAAPGAPMGQIARHSVEFYVRCIEDGLITPDGVGPGKHGEAA